MAEEQVFGRARRPMVAGAVRGRARVFSPMPVEPATRRLVVPVSGLRMFGGVGREIRSHHRARRVWPMWAFAGLGLLVAGVLLVLFVVVSVAPVVVP